MSNGAKRSCEARWVRYRRTPRAWGKGEGGEAGFARVLRESQALGVDLYVFYEGLKLWEAHLYVFYVSGRLSGGRVSNEACWICDAGCVR